MSGRTIVGLIVFVLVLIGGFYVWNHYVQKDQADSGAVHWVSGKPTPEEDARFKKENAGETADGQSEHKTLTARQDDATGFQDGAAAAGQTPTTPIAGATAPAAPTVSTTAQPTPKTTTPEPQPAPSTYPAAPAPSYAAQSYPPAPAPTYAAPVGMPMSDSQSANAPNGMRFGGSGKYQWYRQGNLTWRIDTASGRSCIIYATQEEWLKQIVYSHGCGRNA